MKIKITKLILTLIIFTCMCQANSQSIKMGQDAQEIKQIVEWSTKNHRKSDSYGNRASSYWTYDTKYYNGALVEVSQCYQNQYLHDFRVNADYCKRYIMENNKLSYVLTQFENISIEKLRENYNSMYSESTISGFFFFDKYKNYSKIYLAKNGLATIEMRKTIISELPKAVQQTLTSKLTEIKKNEEMKNMLPTNSNNNNFFASDRRPLISRNPNYICNEEGKVVVQISIDKSGKPFSAKAGITGTTNLSKCLLEQCEIAAMNTEWESTEEGPAVQFVKVVYNFTLN